MRVHWTFTKGMAFTEDHLVIAAARDDLDDFAPFTSIFQYSTDGPNNWRYDDQDWRACSITYFGPKWESFDDFVILSEEGDVRYFGDHAPLLEKIPGAGIFSEGAKNWGYLADLQQIGEHLYACGYRGQVYKRLGPDDWVHMDEGLLQAPAPDTPMAESIALSVINGPHESAIYAAGYQHCDWLPPRAFFWNGRTWRPLELPKEAERIINICVESESRIWMCGSNGTLLLGNAKDGFKSLSKVEDNQLFTSVCLYRKMIFLGSNLGLFFYDPANHAAGIRKVATGLKPEIQDANIVDSYEDTLWSIGPKDIVRFNGKEWERIHHPDNPKIG
jgi:hypothetical protein